MIIFNAYFWEQMDELTQEIPKGKKVYIGGDFNGHVERERRGLELVHGGQGLWMKNETE